MRRSEQRYDEYDPYELKNDFISEDAYQYDQSYDISIDEIEDKTNSCLNLQGESIPSGKRVFAGIGELISGTLK